MVLDPFTEIGRKTIILTAETKHLNSTRTARPPRAWQFESNSNAKVKKASQRDAEEADTSWAESSQFQGFIAFVIVTNAVAMGLYL